MTKIVSNVINWGMRIVGFFLYLVWILPVSFGKVANYDSRLLLFFSITGIFLIIISYTSPLGKGIIPFLYYLHSLLKKISDLPNQKRIGIILLGFGICIVICLSWLNYHSILERLQIVPYHITDLSIIQIQGGWNEVPIRSLGSTIDERNQLFVLVDGNSNTLWNTVRYQEQEYMILIDLGETVPLGRLSWQGNPSFLDSLPDDYRIVVSLDGISWNDLSQGKAVETNILWRNVTIPPKNVRYIRLYLKTKRADSLLYQMCISEIKIYQFKKNYPNESPVVLLGWSNPSGGDFGHNNIHYDLRWSTKPIVNENDWESADIASGTPIFNKPGDKEKAMVELPRSLVGKTVYFSIRTITGGRLYSRISNQSKITISPKESTISWR